LEVLLAREMGFCFGVKRALTLVERAAAQHQELRTLGAVVHNRQVVARLESLGVRPARSLDEVASGAVAVPSHGAPPEVFAEVESRGLQLVDATCPMVKAAQKQARQLADDGFQVAVFGDPGHSEVKGVVAWARGRAVVVSDDADLARLAPSRKLAVLSQTTQSLAAFQRLVTRIIEQKLATSSQIVVHNTICNATSERQLAALELARQVDAMVVIGGRDSANTRHLAELCGGVGVPTRQVEGEDELEAEWLADCRKVGVTAGASTPDWIIEKVLERIRSLAH